MSQAQFMTAVLITPSISADHRVLERKSYLTAPQRRSRDMGQTPARRNAMCALTSFAVSGKAQNCPLSTPAARVVGPPSSMVPSILSRDEDRNEMLSEGKTSHEFYLNGKKLCMARCAFAGELHTVLGLSVRNAVSFSQYVCVYIPSLVRNFCHTIWAMPFYLP